MKSIQEVILTQRSHVQARSNHSFKSRINNLKLLKNIIESNEELIYKALKHDLGKSRFEAYLSEIDFCLHELNLHIKKLKSWMRGKKVRSALTFFPVKSYIYSEPRGHVLIIAPWNYPFQLLIAPLIGALSAGNSVIVKPSEIASETAAVLERIINENFSPEVVRVINGGIPETTELLNEKFDYIFYTGNGIVGKIILEKAAKYLTPVTLELGGKSPCFVYTKQLDLSAKRIVWGKFFNAGQTCVAPDYIIMPEKDIESFVLHCKKWIKHFYGCSIENSPDYGRIINEKHFKRLKSYLCDAEILFGGDSLEKDLYLSPTIIKANLSHSVMQDEIFGPILPILAQESLSGAINSTLSFDKPLAAYAFLDSREDKERIIHDISAGGMVINDTIIHLSNDKLPFGGVGASGMGAYHGKFSFDLFSHKKAVMKRTYMLEQDFRYPPYTNKLDVVRKLLKIFS